MSCIFKYSNISDLVFHLMAYMKVDNQSDLYSREYIDSIEVRRREGISPEAEMAALASYYNSNFERLAALNFLPFGTDGVDAFEETLYGMPFFTDNDKKCFIEPFVDILRREAPFYYSVRDEFLNENADLITKTEGYIKKSLGDFSCIFNYTGKSAAMASLSHSLTRFGRGMSSRDTFGAIAPCPGTEAEIPNAFFQLLHEYSHTITDPCVGKNINMRDGSHMIAEYYVILFDHYLIKAIRPQDSEAYMKYALAMFDLYPEHPTEDDMIRACPLSAELYSEMLALTYRVICAK